MIAIQPLMIAVDPELLSDKAQEMIRLMGRNPQARRFCVRGVSHPYPEVRLRDEMGWAERVRKFGIPGRIFATGAAQEAYIERVIAVYGETLFHAEYTWMLPTEGVSRCAPDDGQAGAAWLNIQAENLEEFCQIGSFQPIHPTQEETDEPNH